jgi:uncharacterized protein YggE
MRKTSSIMLIACCIILAIGTQVSAQRTIEVIGKAEVKVIPDEVVLTFSVETSNEDLQKARQLNDNIVTGITSIVKDYGVKPGQIQLGQLNIQPRYKSYPKNNETDGYQIAKIITITINDMFRFDDILTDILKLGANRIMDIQFKSTESHKYRKEAVTLAVQAAKEKAEAMAAALDQIIGAPLEIKENYFEDYQKIQRPEYMQFRVSRGAGSGPFNAVESYGEDIISASETLSPGQVSFTALVEVKFELQ